MPPAAGPAIVKRSTSHQLISRTRPEAFRAKTIVSSAIQIPLNSLACGRRLMRRSASAAQLHTTNHTWLPRRRPPSSRGPQCCVWLTYVTACPRVYGLVLPASCAQSARAARRRRRADVEVTAAHGAGRRAEPLDDRPVRGAAPLHRHPPAGRRRVVREEPQQGAGGGAVRRPGGRLPARSPSAPRVARASATTLHEYISFIVLLTALFAISGGVYLSGDPLATPRNNITFLFVGAVLANFIGTTGAAMLLVRPVLRANAERTHMRHTVIFLIFIVCNIGGLLTPLGDPPLFLGFLRGVDFFWTLRLLAAVGDGRRSHAARLRGLRGARLPARAGAGGGRRPRRVRADPRPGQAQRALPRRRDRRRPRLAAARRRRRGDRLPLPARGRSWWR